MQSQNAMRLLANEGICLITHPEVAMTLGKSEAIFLQQLHYWLTSNNEIGITHDGRRWIYNSYKAWADNLKIYSESTIRRAISKLEKLGILLTENLNKKRSDHTKWYSINYDALKAILPNSSLKKEKRIGDNETDECLLKMNSPSVQNEQNIIKENKNNFRKEKQSYTQASRKNENNTEVLNKPTFNSSDNVLDEMIAVWNEVVEEGKRAIELNKKRISFLKVAFETKFNSCLEKWTEFCRKIASSKFLMGEIKASFKASLDWVLKFDILQRILEGDYGVGDRIVLLRQESNNKSILQNEIKNLDENEELKEFRVHLLNHLGATCYKSWFNQVSIRLQGHELQISCISNFIKDYVERLFYEDIKRAANSIWSNVTVKMA